MTRRHDRSSADRRVSVSRTRSARDRRWARGVKLRPRPRTLGPQDWELMEYVIEQDYILVTRNAQDFRGAGPANPGGLHAVTELHAGLICLDRP